MTDANLTNAEMKDAFDCLWSFQSRTTWLSSQAERDAEMKAAVAIGRALRRAAAAQPIPDKRGETMTLSEAEFHAFALRKWREREMTFDPRVRRVEPDAMDRASGAWAKFVSELRSNTAPEGKE